MTLSLEGPHWRFALEFYGQPGVAAACLTLQAEANLDVMHLILLLYADIALGRSLSCEEIVLARERMAAWRQASVLPLRGLRQSLKPARADFPEREKEMLRTQVKNAELLAEQIQLAAAVAWLPRHPPGSGLPIEDALQALVETYRSGQPADDVAIRQALGIVLDKAVRLRAGWRAGPAGV